MPDAVHENGNEPSADFLELFGAEVDQQVQAEQQFSTALATRASLLITAVGLLSLAKPTGVEGSGVALGFHYLSVIMGLAAGAAGIRVLFLRTANTLDLDAFWDDYSGGTVERAAGAVALRKLEDLEARRGVNASKTWWIRAGFIMMLGAIASAALSFAGTL